MGYLEGQRDLGSILFNVINATHDFSTYDCIGVGADDLVVV